MKVRHIIIIVIVLGLMWLMYSPIFSKQEEVDTGKPAVSYAYLPIINVHNENVAQQKTAYGQIMSNNQLNIVMQAQGVVERENRSLKEGDTFKKNDVLIKLERTDALYNLLSRRSSLSNLVAGVLPDISLDFPQEKTKWENYLNQLDPVKPLADLPEIKSQKESLFVRAKNIISEFYAIKAQEKQLENYYYLAPFDGTVVSGGVVPGQLVTPGVSLATIAKINDYEVKAPINLNDISSFQYERTINYTNAQGDTVGEGKLLRKAKAINQQTQSLDMFFSISPKDHSSLYQGMFLNLNVSEKLLDSCMVLPDQAVINGSVQLIRDSLIHETAVNIIGTKRDSVYVKGLVEGEQVVLTPYASPEDSTKFIGISK